MLSNEKKRRERVTSSFDLSDRQFPKNQIEHLLKLFWGQLHILFRKYDALSKGETYVPTCFIQHISRICLFNLLGRLVNFTWMGLYLA